MLETANRNTDGIYINVFNSSLWKQVHDLFKWKILARVSQMQMKYDTNGRSHVTEGNENQKISNFNQFFSIFQPKKVIGTIQHILIPGFENQHLRMKRAILFLRISLLSSSSCPRPMPSSWRKSSWKYCRFTSVRMSGRKTVPCLRHCVRQPENSIVIGINIVFVDSVSIIVIIVNNNTNIITCQAPWRAQGDAEVLPDWRSEAKNCSWSSFWWNTWKMIMASVMITDVMRKLCHQQLQCLSRVQCARLCLGKILFSSHYFCRSNLSWKFLDLWKVSNFCVTCQSPDLLCPQHSRWSTTTTRSAKQAF